MHITILHCTTKGFRFTLIVTYMHCLSTFMEKTCVQEFQHSKKKNKTKKGFSLLVLIDIICTIKLYRYHSTVEHVTFSTKLMNS